MVLAIAMEPQQILAMATPSLRWGRLEFRHLFDPGLLGPAQIHAYSPKRFTVLVW